MPDDAVNRRAIGPNPNNWIIDDFNGAITMYFMRFEPNIMR